MKLVKFLSKGLGTENQETQRSNLIISNPYQYLPDYSLTAFYNEGYPNPYIYRAYNLIGNIISSLSVYCVNERNEEVPLPFILQKPNRYLTFSAFVKQAVLNYLLGGNAFIVYNNPDGTPALYCFNALQMSIKIPQRFKIGDPVLFEYGQGAGKSIIPNENVLWWYAIHPKDMLMSLSPFKSASMCVDANNIYIDYVRRLFNNQGLPPKVKVTTKGGITKEQAENLKSYLYDKIGTKAVTLEGDINLEPFGWNPKDLQSTELNKDVIKDIAVATGVPSILLGDTSTATYSNYQTARLQLYQETALPLAKEFFALLSAFISQKMQTSVEILIDYDAIEAFEPIRETKRNSTANLYRSGMLTLNEARQELGYAILEENGDRFYQENILDMQEPNENAEQDSQKSFTHQHSHIEAKAKKKYVVIRPPSRRRPSIQPFRNALAEIFGRYLEKAKYDALENINNLKSLSEFKLETKNLDDYLEDIEKNLSDIITDSMIANLKRLKKYDPSLFNYIDSVAINYAKNHGGELITQITETTRKEIAALVEQAVQEGWSNNKLAKALEESFTFSRDRAKMIARTETAFADVHGAVTSYKKTGITKKCWLVAGDPCDDCLANEQAGIIDMDTPFPSADSPPAHPNCECDIAPVTDWELEELEEAKE